MKRVVLTAVWITLPLHCMAAAAQEAEEKALGTVVVTATRTEVPLEAVTNSVSVVSEQDIANRQTQAVADALRDVPGVDVSQSGSPGTTTSVFIRGAESDQTLILIDGVEVNSPTLGGFNFGNIMTDNVGRIEVLRGAGGTLYGSEAMGGVINILSKKGEGPLHLSVASGGGNIGTSSQLATVTGESGMVAYSGSVGYLTTAGYRPINDDFSDLTNAFRIDVTPIEHGTLRGFWRMAHSSLGLADNNIGNGLAAGGAPLLDADARQRDEFYLAKAEWEHSPIANLTYRISGAYTETINVLSDAADAQEQMSTNFFPAFFTTYFRVPSDITTAETQANYTEGTIGVSTAGFEFKEETGKLKSVNLGGGPPDRFAHSRSNYAGYVQQQLRLFDERFTAIGGFRADGNEDFGNAVSSAWSLGYVQEWGAPGWNTHVKGGYTEGFRAPTFNELFFPSSGNRNLDAETSSEYNGGVTQHLGMDWLALDSTYFTRRTSNLIQFVPLAQCPSAVVPPGVFFTSCNFGRTDVRGVETALTAGPISGLSWQGTYSYLDFDVLGGQKLLRRPHNRMATALNYDGSGVRDGDAFNANLNVVYVGERTDFDPLTFDANAAQEAFTRVDLALRYDMPLPGTPHRIGWFARIQNLFDRNYQEVRGFKSPPINVLAGARVMF
jgi:vitamin B12 transporter